VVNLSLLDLGVLFLTIIVIILVIYLRQKKNQTNLLIENKIDEYQKSIDQFKSHHIQTQIKLSEQIQNLTQVHFELSKQTQKLGQALTQPHVRGQWAEIQLRRLVEISGMLKHCDFLEQNTWSPEDKSIRPDLVITLPYDRFIAVDAKCPLTSFYLYMEEDHKKHREDHVRLMRSHVETLSSKNYWKHISSHPEFVFMYVPIESVYLLTLEVDMGFMEWALSKGVVIATPTSLISLLKTMAYCWKQQELETHTKEILALSQKLLERAKTLDKHFLSLGQSLKQTQQHFDKVYGSYQNRLLVTLKKFQSSPEEDQPD